MWNITIQILSDHCRDIPGHFITFGNFRFDSRNVIIIVADITDVSLFMNYKLS